MADRRRITQVIGNLLSNAARHSPESSVIRVAAVRDGVHVEVSVVDEGRGIPAERLPHLFRKFSRWEDDDAGGDTGLGLAICKGIVEAHGGRIWAESEGPRDWAHDSPSPSLPSKRPRPSAFGPLQNFDRGQHPGSPFSWWMTIPKRSGTSGKPSLTRATTR